jgi:hypothetical protein
LPTALPSPTAILLLALVATILSVTFLAVRLSLFASPRLVALTGGLAVALTALATPIGLLTTLAAAIRLLTALAALSAFLVWHTTSTQ